MARGINGLREDREVNIRSFFQITDGFKRRNQKFSKVFFFKCVFTFLSLLVMGRTVPSFRPALEHEIESWKDFKRALRAEDQEIFHKLMNFARIHSDAGSLSARPMLSEILFMSFAIEQEKKVEILEKRVKELEEKLKAK